MDVFVGWEDGSQNIVSSSELKAVKCKCIGVGNKVKMLYDRKWYKGTVLAIENVCESEDHDSEEDIPLVQLQKGLNLESKQKTFSENESLENVSLCTLREQPQQKLTSKNYASNFSNCHCSSSCSSVYNAVAGPPFGICVIRECKKDVWATCHHCQKLLCFEHFNDSIKDGICLHCDKKVCEIGEHKDGQNTPLLVEDNELEVRRAPESFLMEGEAIEEGNRVKVRRTNKQKLAKALRNSGKAYFSTSTKKSVPARRLKEGCNVEKCKKSKKLCYQITEEQRSKIFQLFNDIGELEKQREFLARHMQITNKQRITTKNEMSRRQHTMIYTLRVNNKSLVVCKKMFLATLGVSERMCRTALAKINDIGILEKDKRGGRQRSTEIKKMEIDVRLAIECHINRFPKVESHICRAKTSKMYLHPDLSLQKMYSMFVEELNAKGSMNKPSYHTYRRVFKQQNLSFLCPLSSTSSSDWHAESNHTNLFS